MDYLWNDTKGLPIVVITCCAISLEVGIGETQCRRLLILGLMLPHSPDVRDFRPFDLPAIQASHAQTASSFGLELRYQRVNNATVGHLGCLVLLRSDWWSLVKVGIVILRYVM